ncbi:MAG: alanine/ornithine racemase family PLP-dependent enzyme [Bacilli bacterium]|nr:alanine/ornithine racemase family PLP-dependent enzyme [Bacilli bacterium]MBN2877727.1 alanine/ornithine racemase family PLP-dependent enzyme [Bacilli bacterium]
MYPRLIVHQAKLKHNIDTMLKMASKNHIPNITFVIKAFAGHEEILGIVNQTELTSIGDSRIHNLKKFLSYSGDKMLLRIPMLSEVSDVIRYASTSLESELSVIQALNEEAKKKNRIHNIILMFDLGDLREGIYYKSEYLDLVETVSKLSNIHIKGIGTNLTCYGGLVPSNTILQRLIEIKHNIENQLGFKLELVSGGNSSSVTLFDKSMIPTEINHLRLGESILFGKETSYSTEIEGLFHDVFSFEAEVIECKEKPSYPDGDISINSFGEVPNIVDKGMMTRLILAVGKQDCILENLKPMDLNLSVLGGSSDHLILESRKNTYAVGDIVRFHINYPALVHLMNSDYIEKVFQ